MALIGSIGEFALKAESCSAYIELAVTVICGERHKSGEAGHNTQERNGSSYLWFTEELGTTRKAKG